MKKLGQPYTESLQAAARMGHIVDSAIFSAKNLSIPTGVGLTNKVVMRSLTFS